MSTYLTITVDSIQTILKVEDIANIRRIEIKNSVVNKAVLRKDLVDYDNKYAIIITMSYGFEYISGFYTDEDRARDEFRNLTDIIASEPGMSIYHTTDGTVPEWTEIRILKETKIKEEEKNEKENFYNFNDMRSRLHDNDRVCGSEA